MYTSFLALKVSYITVVFSIYKIQLENVSDGKLYLYNANVQVMTNTCYKMIFCETVLSRARIFCTLQIVIKLCLHNGIQTN